MSFRALFYLEQNYSYAVLRPLQKEIVASGGSVRWFLVGNEVDSSYFHDNEQCLPSVQAVKTWQPEVVFVPGNTVSKVVPGLKVGIFHGFNAGKINRRGRQDHFEIRGFFDLYCTQGPTTTEPFLALKQQHGFFDVKETGWPMIDPLFHTALDNPYINGKDTRKTVLFCSTFSPKYSCAETLFDEVKRLKQQGNYRWLVQFHPKMAADTVKKFKALEDENLQYVETDNVIPLLQVADIMLCDTSSILLMFLLLGKPVVSFRNQNSASHLFNINQVDMLERALSEAVLRPEKLMQAITEYCAQMHPYSDGKSSARVVDTVKKILLEGLKAKKSKPVNMIREFKERKKLNYWRC